MARSLWKGNKFDRNTTNFKELYKLDCYLSIHIGDQ